MIGFTFHSLSLSDRPALFEEISGIGRTMREPVVRGRFGERTGWLVADGPLARAILKSGTVSKSRPEVGQDYLGGVGALNEGPSAVAKRQLIAALSVAAHDRTAVHTHLGTAIGRAGTDSERLTEAFASSMLTQLTGTAAGSVDGAELRRIVARVWEALERLQDEGGRPETGADELGPLIDGLVVGSDSDFLRVLREHGWDDHRIVGELRAMVLSSWGSTTAAVLSALSVGRSEHGAQSFLKEVMRLYPPSFLIGRTVLTRDLRFPFEPGDLVVISPWLIHRNATGWANPENFDPGRWAGAARGEWHLPFGVGPRRCPASAFAKAQIIAALEMLGGQTPLTPGKVALVEGRSPSLMPDGCPVDHTAL